MACAEGFYLPGVAPREYAESERVEIKVNKLSSTKTQLPYDYYSLPFCRPAEITNAVENLGEVLHGSVIQNSPYDIFMGKTDFKILCKNTLNFKTATLSASMVASASSNGGRAACAPVVCVSRGGRDPRLVSREGAPPSADRAEPSSQSTALPKRAIPKRALPKRGLPTIGPFLRGL